MTEADQIEAAKAAMDKATPGPWAEPYYDNYPGDRGWWVHNGVEGSHEYAVAVTFEGNPKAEYDALLIAAAPALVRRVQELEAEGKYLKDQLREYELALAGSDALVMSHEGHIAKSGGFYG